MPSHCKCFSLVSTCAEGVQFYCPPRTYPAIPHIIVIYLPYCMHLVYFRMNIIILKFPNILQQYFHRIQSCNCTSIEVWGPTKANFNLLNL